MSPLGVKTNQRPGYALLPQPLLWSVSGDGQLFPEGLPAGNIVRSCLSFMFPPKSLTSLCLFIFSPPFGLFLLVEMKSCLDHA